MREPRILIYDLEVTPMLCWTYRRYEANVIHVERESYVMCFSYKWFGEKKIKSVSQTDFPEQYAKDPYDDKEVVKVLWDLINEADVVIAHNAAGFDNKVSNERFLVHRLGPTSPYKTIDTLITAKRYFKNSSNSLDNLCKKLGIGDKTKDKHSELWHDCVNGDTKSWNKMIKYCKNDVKILEELYFILRPYMPNHPNVALLAEKPNGCPKCGSVNIQFRGLQRSNTSTFRRIQCVDCGAWSRVRVCDKSAEKPQFVNITPSA
jgi:DNA polymerase elongation subunit (family B)